MFAQNNLKQTGKKPLTLVGAAKAVFWPNRENVKNDAQTEFFRAGYFVILFVHGCSNITNFRFRKSYGRKLCGSPLRHLLVITGWNPHY